jgi:hypothetical protein
MTVTVKDLADTFSLHQDDPRKHEFLLCFSCGAEYSANKADYFMRGDGDVFECCDKPMVLARRESALHLVKE